MADLRTIRRAFYAASDKAFESRANSLPITRKAGTTPPARPTLHPGPPPLPIYRRRCRIYTKRGP
jgi:hypothetical protein